MKTFSLGPFIGVANRRPDHALRLSTKQVQGDYLRGAVNVDINNVGQLERRKAAVLTHAVSGAHSLHLLDATAGLLVIDSILYAITLPAYSQTLLKVLASDAPMAYVAQGGDTYYSNGTDAGRITAGAVYPLGLPTPDAPALAVIGGGLLPGNYQVAIGYAHGTTGEAGGVSYTTQIELPSQGGIRVMLPGGTAGATLLDVYLTAANGTVPQRAVTVASDAGSVDLIALAEGRDAPRRREVPLPPGRLFGSSGRLCAYASNMLYLGLPHRPGYYDPLGGYIPFPQPVSVALDAQGGIYVAADKTYWIPHDGPVADVLPYGAVPGTEFSAPDKSIYGWFGAKGIILASPSGEVEAVMSDTIELTPPASGFSTVFEDGEYRKVVSCGWCLNLANKAATTYEGWDFTSFSGGYGTASGGIYTLAAGGEVPWSVDFGKPHLGSDALKHLPTVYLGVESDDLMHLTVTLPNGTDYTYAARASSGDLMTQRVDVGKGLRATWFGLALTGATDFRLASIDFAAAATKRRL